MNFEMMVIMIQQMIVIQIAQTIHLVTHAQEVATQPLQSEWKSAKTASLLLLKNAMTETETMMMAETQTELLRLDGNAQTQLLKLALVLRFVEMVKLSAANFEMTLEQ